MTCSPNTNGLLLPWPLLWWLGALDGWATGWRRASVRSASMIRPSHTRTSATTLLRLHVQTLRLRPDAPLSPSVPRRKSGPAALRSV